MLFAGRDVVRLLVLVVAAAAGCAFDDSGLSQIPYDADVGIADAPVDARRPGPGEPDATVDARTATVDARVDATVDAMPDANLDRDGDGRPDAVDNCPDVANADQRDHDGDARGDVCDECPHLAARVATDGDGDGVGDACDPRPGERDRIARFEGFYDARVGLPAGWVSVDGSAADWRVAGGHLEQLRGDREERLVAWNRALAGQAIEVLMRVDAVAPWRRFDPVRTAGPVGGVEVTGGSGQMWGCLLRDDLGDAAGTSLRLIEFLPTGGFDRVITASPAPLAAGTAVRMRIALFAEGPTLFERCDVTPVGASSPTTATSSDRTAITGAVGVRTHGVRARFDYMVAYEPAP